jgi:hypothetical protein
MENSKKICVIGVGGVARAGKDTFVSILIDVLAKNGLKAKRIALADPLKNYCDTFCKDAIGFSSFTQVPEEKNLIRPFLVWFGDAKRKQTNGKFWTNLAEQNIHNAQVDGYDYAIISDVRYDHYPEDELTWLKNKMNGTLVHVSRYDEFKGKVPKSSQLKVQKRFVPPANDHEMINDPKIKKKADYVVEWPTIDVPVAELINDQSMRSYVEKFVQSLKD